MHGLAKYLLTVARSDDDSTAIRIIEDKIQELINSELAVCITIVGQQAKEWSDIVSVSAYVYRDICDKIKERIKK